MRICCGRCWLIARHQPLRGSTITRRADTTCSRAPTPACRAAGPAPPLDPPQSPLKSSSEKWPPRRNRAFSGAPGWCAPRGCAAAYPWYPAPSGSHEETHLALLVVQPRGFPWRCREHRPHPSPHQRPLLPTSHQLYLLPVFHQLYLLPASPAVPSSCFPPAVPSSRHLRQQPLRLPLEPPPHPPTPLPHLPSRRRCSPHRLPGVAELNLICCPAASRTSTSSTSSTRSTTVPELQTFSRLLQQVPPPCWEQCRCPQRLPGPEAALPRPRGPFLRPPEVRE